jgi:hypothetical protein
VLLIVMTTATSACAHILGDENSSPEQFEVVVINNSDEPVYSVHSPPEATAPTGAIGAVRVGEERSIGIGVAAIGDEPGGCFDSHLWLLRSRTGRTYPQADEVSDYADEFEVIRHFAPDECTDQEQIIVEYDGP